MIPGMESLILLISILIAGVTIHIFNLNKIYEKVSRKPSCQVPEEKANDDDAKKKFFDSLSQPQGCNFNAALASAWILFLIALIFYFFLTPTFFEHFNYFAALPSWASNRFGFFFMGLISAAIGLVLLIGLKAHQAYSYYDISKIEKKLIIAVWVLLAMSLFFSVGFGSIYPQLPTWNQQIGAFTAILISELILLSPFILEFLGAKR